MIFQTPAGKPVIQIDRDQDRFDIIIGKQAYCFFNRNALFSSKPSDTSFAPIVGVTVRSSCRKPNQVIKIKAVEKNHDLLKPLIDNISKSDQVKIVVLEEKPDERTENSPKQASLATGSFGLYRKRAQVFSECFDNALTLSETLLRTQLPKTMWGAKELKGYLNRIKNASADLIKNREEFEIAAEHTDFKTGQLESVLMRTGSVNQPVLDTVNRVISDYSTMKRMMTSFLQTFHGLYASDQMFKKYAGYPATWFFDPSVFYNFSERYEDVSDNLIEASRAESSVIKPLYAWKIKVTGEI